MYIELIPTRTIDMITYTHQGFNIQISIYDYILGLVLSNRYMDIFSGA